MLGYKGFKRYRNLNMFYKENNNLLKRYNLRIEEDGEYFYVFSRGILLIKSSYDKSDTIPTLLLLLLRIKPGAYLTSYDIKYINPRIREYGLDYVWSKELYINNAKIKRIMIFNKRKSDRYSKKQIKYFLENISKSHREIGNIIGIPPIAIEDFLDKNKKEKETIGSRWVGFPFAYNKEHEKEVSEYMEKNYQNRHLINRVY